MRTANLIKKLSRKVKLYLLKRASNERIKTLGEKKLLRLFHNSHNSSSALISLLNDYRIDAKNISTIDQFSTLDFTMSKENTFNKFSLEELCRAGTLDNLSSVLTSSGHSGNFAFGLTSRKQEKSIPDLIDLALENVFQIDEKKTLLVNCLPMGVRFPSNTVTQAEVSVREDMALALITKFSPHYDQVIITCDPLFLKLLLDSSTDFPIKWHDIHKHLIIGEETFGENYRNYVAEKLSINPDDPKTGIIGSSMGIGELGLNLCFETLETIALRRSINKNPVLMEKLFGCISENDPLPMLFSYNPLAYYLETHHRDENIYGDLLISILDKNCPIPLFRYKTGDRARLLTNDEIRQAFQEQCLPTPKLPNLPMVCLRGRQNERLDTGLHIGVVKDALYQDRDFADRITGAFRIEKNNPSKVHIQLRKGEKPAPKNEITLCYQDKILFPAENVILWDYDQFPFGKSIDYERKFTYLN